MYREVLFDHDLGSLFHENIDDDQVIVIYLIYRQYIYIYIIYIYK